MPEPRHTPFPPSTLIQIVTLTPDSNNDVFLTTEHHNKYLRILGGTGVIKLVIPDDSVPFPVGSVITVEQAGTNQVGMQEASGVTLFAATGLSTPMQYACIQLIKIDPAKWVIHGGI